MEREARKLIDYAYSQMKDTDAEFERARRAQAEAERAVELANQITSEALKKEIECKKALVQAGKTKKVPKKSKFQKNPQNPKTYAKIPIFE